MFCLANLDRTIFLAQRRQDRQGREQFSALRRCLRNVIENDFGDSEVQSPRALPHLASLRLGAMISVTSKLVGNREMS